MSEQNEPLTTILSGGETEGLVQPTDDDTCTAIGCEMGAVSTMELTDRETGEQEQIFFCILHSGILSMFDDGTDKASEHMAGMVDFLTDDEFAARHLAKMWAMPDEENQEAAFLDLIHTIRVTNPDDDTHV